METTKCIFNTKSAECRYTNRHNVKMLACGKDLDTMLGLDFFHTIHETEMSHVHIGGFLKPSKGVTFKRNTVIIPERYFFDVTYRPEDLSDQPTLDHLEYSMNPRVSEFVSTEMGTTKSHDARLKYEILRNLSKPPKEADIGPHPGQDKLFENAVQYITNKLSLSEAQIEKQSIFEHINTTNSLVYGGNEFVPLAETQLSTCFKYLLSN